MMHQRAHKQEPEAEAAVSSSPKQQPLMAKSLLLSRHHHIAVLAFLCLSLAALFACMSRSFSPCSSPSFPAPRSTRPQQNHYPQPNGLELINGKQVILVSHELSLSGGPLLLMELAMLLKRAGGEVKWVTNQKDVEKSFVSQSLESKLLKNDGTSNHFPIAIATLLWIEEPRGMVTIQGSLLLPYYGGISKELFAIKGSALLTFGMDAIKDLVAIPRPLTLGLELQCCLSSCLGWG